MTAILLAQPQRLPIRRCSDIYKNTKNNCKNISLMLKYVMRVRRNTFDLQSNRMREVNLRLTEEVISWKPVCQGRRLALQQLF